MRGNDPMATDDDREVDRPDAMFTLKVALGALAIFYLFDAWTAVVFFAGWWWAVRDLSETN